MTNYIHEPHLSIRGSMHKRLDECAVRWLGQRSQKDSIAACHFFIDQCMQLTIDHSLAIEQRHIDCYKLGMENRALSASTINTRMVAVKAYVDYLKQYATGQGNAAREGGMGYDDAYVFFGIAIQKLGALKFSYATRSKQAKWHMTDDQHVIVNQCLSVGFRRFGEAGLMADYINWTLETGLRVEETLRLQWADFEGMAAGAAPAIIVPGTKNEHSRVRIPISDVARAIIIRRYETTSGSNPSARLFDISYVRIKAIWNALRERLGVDADPTSTLKALRRNFALNALRKGLPPRIIQELMRHSSLETTMGYLRLLGMSDNPETRALLNRQIGAGRPASVNATPAPRDVLHVDTLWADAEAAKAFLLARGFRVEAPL
jgi:integrase